jgi:hypothetical protein
MSSKTKRQITIERHSITRIRISGKSPFVFCEVCQTETLAFTPEQVAGFFRVSVDDICQQIEDGQFHLMADETGVIICGNSVAATK